ncbi:neuroligin-4, Y-linked-like [Tigriopus californicus]|nr:neuroligin-4, Y-linked-like [Tigriopus californicus]
MKLLDLLLSVLLLLLLPSLRAVSSEESDESENGDTLPRSKVILTKYGQVQGRVHEVQSETLAELRLRLKSVEVFQGIRYATPPVGSNRWQPTRAPSPWKGVLQATSPGPVCPQKFPTIRNESEALLRMSRARMRYLQFLEPHLQRQSEDCLYLNLFAPKQDEGSSEALVPVMIYVHGESFSWGSGNLWDARVLASYGNVLVITFNYRIGVLGFLNTNGSPLSRGQVANYGIMDQMAVLQWVQENVARFGGDPKQVTLFGHGTGAACIEYLAHSPTTVPGLFHRVILMSGSLFASWSRVRDPLNYAVQLGKKFNCSIPIDLTNDHEEIVTCLRGIPMEQLIHAKLRVPSFHLEFGPSFDGVTIKDNFADIKGKRSFGTRTYEALVGVVNHDFFDDLSEDDVQNGITIEQRNRMLQTFVRNQYSAHLQEILLTLQNEYTDWAETVQSPHMNKDQILSAFSDGLYGAPGIFSAGTFFRKSKNTFFYHFTHHTKSGPYATSGDGATHGSELPYIFGIPLKNVWPHISHTFTKSEVMLSRATMTFWTNFARSGDPNMPAKFLDFKSRYRTLVWDSYDEQRKYLELGVRPRVGHHYRGHKMSIWLNLIPQLHKTGQNAIFPAHNSLTLEGPAWGVVRNGSNVQAAIAHDAGSGHPISTTCMTFAESQQVLYQHNDTLVRLEEASKYAYSYALGLTVGLAAILCLLNGILFMCICSRKRAMAAKSMSAQSQSNTPVTSRTGSLDFFQNSQTATPHHQVVADISGNVRSIPVPRSNMGSSASLPRLRNSGQRTILVQPHHHHACNGGTRAMYPNGSYIAAPRPDPGPPGGCSSDMESPTLRPSSSSLCGTPVASIRSATVKPSRTVRRERDSIVGGERGELDSMRLEEMPAPPAEFDQPSVETLLLQQQTYRMD